MAIAAILALFPVLLLFAPRLAVALLVLAIVLLCQKRVAAARRPAARRLEDAPRKQVAWKDPWSTDGLDQRRR